MHDAVSSFYMFFHVMVVYLAMVLTCHGGS